MIPADSNLLLATVPVLSCAEARTLEDTLFGGDEEREWTAMQQAGRAIADSVLADAQEIGGFSENGVLLVLVGKGHNGGDALIAAGELLKRFPSMRAEVVFAFGQRALRPLAMRSWRALGDRVSALPLESLTATTSGLRYELCLDGVFGFQFRPPADDRVAALFKCVNALAIRLRAAVDLPSAGLFHADFTYATGSVKSPVVGARDAGRVRYLDLGFFREPIDTNDGGYRVLTREMLAPLAGLRSPHSDKRTYGHVFIIGGSRSYPGAVMMTVLSALRSGAGLVTAFVPESVVGAFAAQAPEAMWVGWPETPGGGLALEGEYLLRERIDRATVLVMGPGLSREPEVLALSESVARTSRIPMVLDADALQREIVDAGEAPRILTPHAGEFSRISGQAELQDFAAQSGMTVVLKGPVTRIASGGNRATANLKETPEQRRRATIYHSFHGGPVLARGGSGDLLAGLIGGLLAQAPEDPLLAAARGVVWHGCAADLLARAVGQTPVRVTQLLDFLPAALRASGMTTRETCKRETRVELREPNERGRTPSA